MSLITARNDLIRAALFPPNQYHYSAKERDAFNFVKSAVSHDPSVKQSLRHSSRTLNVTEQELTGMKIGDWCIWASGSKQAQT